MKRRADETIGRHPEWCQGCAWRKGADQCKAFADPKDPWLKDGRCEGWVDERGRKRIERAIADYLPLAG